MAYLRQLRPFLHTLVFLLLFFFAWRCFFLLSLLLKKGSIDWNGAVLACYYGIRMDLSIIGYAFVPLAIFRWMESVFAPRVFIALRKFLIVFFIVSATLILLGNVVIYHFWGLMLNYRALTYLSDPKEVLINLDWLQIGRAHV